MRSKTKRQLEHNPYRYLTTAGKYVIGRSENETTLAEMTPKQQKAMDYAMPHPKSDIALAAGGATEIIATDILSNATHLLTASGFYAVQGLGLAAMTFVTARSHFGRAQARRTRTNLKLDMPDRTDALRFTNSAIQYKLPASVLEQEVTFTSETGITQRTAGELLESTGMLLGISSKTKKQHIVGSVHPQRLFTSLIVSQDTAESTEQLIEASFEHLTGIHEATTNLPKWGRSDMDRIPEGLRASDERICTNLLLSSLGAFAVARAHLGQNLAESIKDLYAERGEDPLILDAHRVGNPTAENLTWSELQSTKSYLSGLGNHL